MSPIPLSRLFWFGAAAILIVAAFVAISAVVGGSFDETDGKILGTLLSLLVAGATAVSGLALVERRVQPALGWIAAVGAGGCFALQAGAIWDEFTNDTLGDLAASSIPVVLALLIVTTQRLLLRDERLAALFYGTSVAAALATALTVVAIWDDGSDGLWQAVAVLSILTVLGYLLLPVVQRLTTTPPGAPTPGARVLAALDGVELVASHGRIEGVAVEPPSPGERLVLRRRG